MSIQHVISNDQLQGLVHTLLPRACKEILESIQKSATNIILPNTQYEV